MFNGQFWACHFQRTFAPHLSRLLEVLEQRLLPTFGTIDKEADAKSNAEWERLMLLPGDPDQDPSVLADHAFDIGLMHYQAMYNIRQSLLNIYASALYHAWEQQLLEFIRREVLQPAEEHDNSLLNLKTALNRLKVAGLDISKFSCWPKIIELRLVTNTVKHADGASADELKLRRPDLFEHPDLKEFTLSTFNHVPRVYTPLSGDDVYVTIEELRAYCTALVEFWSELADSLVND